jgi:hypothetical protein
MFTTENAKACGTRAKPAHFQVQMRMRRIDSPPTHIAYHLFSALRKLMVDCFSSV